MRIGCKTSLQPATSTDLIETLSWSDVVDFWKRADAIDAIESGWVNDHLYHPYFPDDSTTSHSFEAFTALASLATSTNRIRIGALVAGNLFRHPAVLARMAVTIDHISGGRFELGMGAGWHEREHGDHGIELMAPGRRLDAFAESCRIVRSLLGGEILTMTGDHYSLDQARLEPRPVQNHLPLTIGGSGEKRMLRIVAQYADHWNFGSIHDVDDFVHKCEVLQSHCDAVGRDYREITKSIQLWVPAEAEALVASVSHAKEMGADMVILYFEQAHWHLLEPGIDALGGEGLLD